MDYKKILGADMAGALGVIGNHPPAPVPASKAEQIKDIGGARGVVGHPHHHRVAHHHQPK